MFIWSGCIWFVSKQTFEFVHLWLFIKNLIVNLFILSFPVALPPSLPVSIVTTWLYWPCAGYSWPPGRSCLEGGVCPQVPRKRRPPPPPPPGRGRSPTASQNTPTTYKRLNLHAENPQHFVWKSADFSLDLAIEEDREKGRHKDRNRNRKCTEYFEDAKSSFMSKCMMRVAMKITASNHVVII